MDEKKIHIKIMRAKGNNLKIDCRKIIDSSYIALKEKK